VQERGNEIHRRRRAIEGLTQIASGVLEQRFPFFRDSPPLELVLVECAALSEASAGALIRAAA
jgi:hypothetical protein